MPPDFFSFEQPRARPTSQFYGCGLDAHPVFADSFIDVIRREEAARAQAIKRAQAARRAQQQRQAQAQAQAYLERLYHEQRREAERQYALEQQRRKQYAEYQRRKQHQYAEYQRRKAYAIEQERRRIQQAQAIRQAQDQSRHLFLALEDLIFGGLDNDNEPEQQQPVAGPSKTVDTPTQPALAAANDKGKAKAVEPEVEEEQPMEQDNDDAAQATTVASAADTDPEEVGPSPAASSVTATSDVPQALAPAPAPKQETLVFEHPFPAGSDTTTINADVINVSVDEQTNQVTVSGLWDLPTRPASPSSARGRSRSPKSARVSDVDENGNEIMQEDNDFVKIDFTPSPSATVKRSFELPKGASAEGLRAELTDDGLKLWVSA